MGRDRWRKLVLTVFVLCIPLPLVLVAAVGLDSGPFVMVRCGWQSRDGWVVEHPREAVTEAEFREFTERQTTCVDIDRIHVNTGLEDDDIVVRPRGARSWIGRGQTLTIHVEAPAGDDVVECGQPLTAVEPGTGTEILTC
jgi:hypothetical protein